LNFSYKTEKNEMEISDDIRERRGQLLLDGCRQLSHYLNNSTSSRGWYQMFYDDQMDYVYCPVGKVSCTNWKRTLILLTGKISESQIGKQLQMTTVYRYMRTLASVKSKYRIWRFADSRYFTFMFVREPLERLVSAYRDKLQKDPNRSIDARIVKQYRPRDYKRSIRHYNVTFAEFVRYVLDQHAAGNVLDRHWMPQSQLCRVCQYRWDVIGHYETLREDAGYVVSRLKSRIMDVGQRHRVANVTFPADSGHRKSGHFLQQMYASVPAADVQALYTLYAVDYTLFGFEHPNVTGFT